MELLVTVGGWKLLTIIMKSSILDAVAVLDTSQCSYNSLYYVYKHNRHGARLEFLSRIIDLYLRPSIREKMKSRLAGHALKDFKAYG